MINAENIKPIQDKVLVIDLEFGEQKTAKGIILSDDDGKSHGIKARWAKVFKVGPKQTELKPDDYVLLQHGRWSRGIEVLVDGEKKKLFLIDYPKGLMLISKSKPIELTKVGK